MMKIDMKQTVPGIDGKPMKAEALKVVCPKCESVIDVKEGKPLTLEVMCISVLNEIKGPDGNSMERKEKQAKIMASILTEDKPDLDADQIVIIEEMIGVSGYRPWVADMAKRLLNGRKLPKVSTPTSEPLPKSGSSGNGKT